MACPGVHSKSGGTPRSVNQVPWCQASWVPVLDPHLPAPILCQLFDLEASGSSSIRQELPQLLPREVVQRNKWNNLQEVLSTGRRLRAHRCHCNILTGLTARHTYLQAGVFPHSQPSHPHVCQQHLAAGVGDEVPVLGSDSQFEAGGVAPVFQLVGQQFHGNLLIMLIRLVQQLHGKLAKVSRGKKRDPGWSCSGHMLLVRDPCPQGHHGATGHRSRLPALYKQELTGFVARGEGLGPGSLFGHVGGQLLLLQMGFRLPPSPSLRPQGPRDEKTMFIKQACGQGGHNAPVGLVLLFVVGAGRHWKAPRRDHRCREGPVSWSGCWSYRCVPFVNSHPAVHLGCVPFSVCLWYSNNTLIIRECNTLNAAAERGSSCRGGPEQGGPHRWEGEWWGPQGAERRRQCSLNYNCAPLSACFLKEIGGSVVSMGRQYTKRVMVQKHVKRENIDMRDKAIYEKTLNIIVLKWETHLPPSKEATT